jgi:hypothetical protein
MVAHSAPTALAPMITIRLGTSPSRNAPSEVTTPGRSIPGMGSSTGVEPVATIRLRPSSLARAGRRARAARCTAAPRPQRRLPDGHHLHGLGPTNRACPLTTVTPLARSRPATPSVRVLVTRSLRLPTADQSSRTLSARTP